MKLSHQDITGDVKTLKQVKLLNRNVPSFERLIIISEALFIAVAPYLTTMLTGQPDILPYQ